MAQALCPNLHQFLIVIFFLRLRASETIFTERNEDDDPNAGESAGKRRETKMKSDDQSGAISFKDAIRYFWVWRQSAISLEVCFLGRGETAETVRVSIDGLVTLVDPQGKITVSGDGREIDLDLRGCRFDRAGETAEGGESFDPRDPDSVLQITFPNGQVCLVFPYRRVSGFPAGALRPMSGMDWLREKLGRPAQRRRSTDRSFRSRRGIATSTIAPARESESKPARTRRRLAIFPISGIAAALLIVALFFAPTGTARLLDKIGIHVSPASLSDPGAQVWVIQSEGNYYCAGSVLAGQKPGRYMTQANALTLGYQPALGRYCGESSGYGSNDAQGRFTYYLFRLRETGHRLLSKFAALSRPLLGGSQQQASAPASGASVGVPRPQLFWPRNSRADSAAVANLPLSAQGLAASTPLTDPED